MVKVKKDEQMAVALELPQSQATRLVQAEVDLELFEAVQKELSRHKPKKIKIRDAITWGLQAYLLKSNPDAAGKLGIGQKK